MKFKNINWNQHPEFPDTHQGFIGEQEIFTIMDIKKGQAFSLKSWPLRTEAFYPSTNEKFLGEYDKLSLAKVKAEEIWNDFTNSLLLSQEEEEECACGGDCACNSKKEEA